MSHADVQNIFTEEKKSSCQFFLINLQNVIIPLD